MPARQEIPEAGCKQFPAAYKEFVGDGAMPHAGDKFPTDAVCKQFIPPTGTVGPAAHASHDHTHVTEIDAAQTAAACKKQWLGCLMSIQDDAERPTFPRLGVQKQRELFASSKLAVRKQHD